MTTAGPRRECKKNRKAPISRSIASNFQTISGGICDRGKEAAIPGEQKKKRRRRFAVAAELYCVLVCGEEAKVRGRSAKERKSSGTKQKSSCISFEHVVVVLVGERKKSRSVL